MTCAHCRRRRGSRSNVLLLVWLCLFVGLVWFVNLVNFIDGILVAEAAHLEPAGAFASARTPPFLS
jgi:hypothetical protein